MSDKTYWVGDNRDNKSVCIKRKIYVKGDEIPSDDVEQERLDEWQKKGLIAVGAESAPVVIIDTDAVKNLKTEIAALKRDVDRIPGFEREIKELQQAAEKAKGGSKAKASKVKDARIKELEDEKARADEACTIMVKELKDSVATLKLDNQEKAALIDKLNDDLETATAPSEDGAGPGGDK